MSFKESFSESENFSNIDEKKTEEVVACRNVIQTNLNKLIKERFIGPAFKLNDNNN